MQISVYMHILDKHVWMPLLTCMGIMKRLSLVHNYEEMQVEERKL